MDLVSFLSGLTGGVLILYFLLCFFLPSYLKEKAKNLATKEDISDITEKVEKIRSQHSHELQKLIHDNNLQIEEIKSLYQLRTIAPDQRIKAHQEAFKLWKNMLSSLHTEKVSTVVMECQDWYNNNCLYLSKEAREAFSLAYNALAMHNSLLNGGGNNSEIKQNYCDITDAGEAIIKPVELPPLRSDLEYINLEDGALIIKSPSDESNQDQVIKS